MVQTNYLLTMTFYMSTVHARIKMRERPRTNNAYMQPLKRD